MSVHYICNILNYNLALAYIFMLINRIRTSENSVY